METRLKFRSAAWIVIAVLVLFVVPKTAFAFDMDAIVKSLETQWLNSGGNFDAIFKIIYRVVQIVGLFLVIGGVVFMKKHAENPQKYTISRIIAAISIGSLFLINADMVTTLTSSLIPGGGPDIHSSLSIVTEAKAQHDKLLAKLGLSPRGIMSYFHPVILLAIIAIMMIFAYVTIISGIWHLYESTKYDQPVLAKAFVKIVSGTLLFGFVQWSI